MDTDLLTLKDASIACGVSLSTLQRKRRARQLTTVVGPARGRRTPPVMVSVQSLLDAGLHPDPSLMAHSTPNDAASPEALRERIARLEGVLLARDGHLQDLRGELRRLHEHIARLQAALAKTAPGGPDPTLPTNPQWPTSKECLQ